MEGVIAFTGSACSLRVCFRQKQEFCDRVFGRCGRGFQNCVAVQQQARMTRKSWECKLARNAPVSVKRCRFWCLLKPGSTSSSVSPEGDETLEIEDVATVNVKFILQRKCEFGESFNIIGEDSLLGAWDPGSAVPLEWSDNHVWTTELKVPVGKIYEFKFLLSGQNGEIEWQPGPNRLFEVSSETSSPLIIMEAWDFEPLLVSRPIEEPNVEEETVRTETQAFKLEVEEQTQHDNEAVLNAETSAIIGQQFEEAQLAASLGETPKADGDDGSNLKDVVEDVMDADSDQVTHVVATSSKSIAIVNSVVDAGAEGPTLKTDGASALSKTVSGESEKQEDNVFQAEVAVGSGITREKAEPTGSGPVGVASVSASCVADPLAKASPATIKGPSSPENVPEEYEVSVKDENEAEKVTDADYGIEGETEASMKLINQEVVQGELIDSDIGITDGTPQEADESLEASKKSPLSLLQNDIRWGLKAFSVLLGLEDGSEDEE